MGAGSANFPARFHLQIDDHGARGSLEAPAVWRWTGHNGPPWFGARRADRTRTSNLTVMSGLTLADAKQLASVGAAGAKHIP
jgi:hypothetical protein